MKMPSLFGAILLGLGIGALILFGIFTWEDTADTYAGKEVFWTEEQYAQFKVAMAPEDVDINDLTVLSSDPPIIVVFRATVPKGLECPYGEKMAGVPSWLLPLGISLLSVVGVSTLAKKVDWDD